MVNLSKSGLAVALSRFKVFSNPNMKLEQYPTDSEIAADALWTAYMAGEIMDKEIVDLGCGTGILGIGAILCGAKKVYFVDIDSDAVKILKENLDSELVQRLMEEYGSSYEIVENDISVFNEDLDMVIMNPPFGTKEKHADKVFLEKAFTLSSTIYSFHKTSTKNFIETKAQDNGYGVRERKDYMFPIKKTMKHHKKKLERVEVSCFILIKN